MPKTTTFDEVIDRLKTLREDFEGDLTDENLIALREEIVEEIEAIIDGDPDDEEDEDELTEPA